LARRELHLLPAQFEVQFSIQQMQAGTHQSNCFCHVVLGHAGAAACNPQVISPYPQQFKP
jgi:predicted TIM-barrel fold metal-dependent hydrolase